jgi:hypothetical protein
MNEAELLGDPTPATRGFLANCLHRLGVATGQNIEKSIGAKLSPLLSRMATLETRCAALAMMIARESPDARTTVSELEAMIDRVKSLESRPAIQYRGVWRDGQEHAPSSFVTHDGSLWHCNATTRAKPGTGADWTLAVKRGKDA